LVSHSDSTGLAEGYYQGSAVKSGTGKKWHRVVELFISNRTWGDDSRAAARSAFRRVHIIIVLAAALTVAPATTLAVAPAVSPAATLAAALTVVPATALAVAPAAAPAATLTVVLVLVLVIGLFVVLVITGLIKVISLDTIVGLRTKCVTWNCSYFFHGRLQHSIWC
jgi:hypothetical protein